jgi:hypothetical protein
VKSGFHCGVIEGFYGRQWDWSTRRHYAELLSSTGLNAYVYCPKGDPYLRKRWQDSWPVDEQRELAQLARVYRDEGLSWGVGLSPYALYRDYSNTARRRLRDKVLRLDDLGGNLLALLFDDMPGDVADLASRQAEIVRDVLEWTCAESLIVCPTYYSHDPVLEQYFGARPERYWEQLGEELPGEIQVFWTGNQVCSEGVTAADIDPIANLLGRRPVLWDNYPVNDGARASRFLHLKPLPHRAPGLQDALSGHLCNPMNQGLLSRYPLLGLARLYGTAKSTPADYFAPDFIARLETDAPLFEELGLDGIDLKEQQKLIAAYAKFSDPAAAEVVEWLKGGYAFDPACLTG